MENDTDYRTRILRHFRQDWCVGQPDPQIEADIGLAHGAKLDEWGRCYNVERDKPYRPDSFSEAFAEALRREDAVIPHPVTRVETEAEKDDLWRSIVEYGRGG